MRRVCSERFSRHRLHKKLLVSDPGMHHGTCVTHVPLCMSGSLTRSGAKNVPGIPGTYATRNCTYLARGPYEIKIYSPKRSAWSAILTVLKMGFCGEKVCRLQLKKIREFRINDGLTGYIIAWLWILWLCHWCHLRYAYIYADHAAELTSECINPSITILRCRSQKHQYIVNRIQAKHAVCHGFPLSDQANAGILLVGLLGTNFLWNLSRNLYIFIQ